MINVIWVALLVIGFLYAGVHGTMEEVNQAIFEGGKEAVSVSIGFISVLVFWLGMMKIAEEAGLLDKLAALFKPIAKRLFPEVPEKDPAMGYILSNMVANLLGLGNAATPLGIKAMERLKKLNGDKPSASRSMITLLAINTSSLTIIPTTVIAIRMQYGSSSPTDIVGTTIVATLASTIAAVLIDRYFYYLRKARGIDQ